MNKKYYAVIDMNNFNKKKIYDSWENCKKNILGIKGIKFKSFDNIEKAKKFLDNYLKNDNLINLNKINNKLKTDIAIYIDGSYKKREHKYSYGMVVVDIIKNISIYEEYNFGTNKEVANLRNVAGEMKGAMRAVQYAKEKNIIEYSLCYDYNGIKEWAKGTWKRNNIFTKKYYFYMQEYMKFQKIFFVKIKSHSNNYWNDFVDKLAKKALNL